ncbi:unnamed protein product, partial [Closterium sp. NIES-64]
AGGAAGTVEDAGPGVIPLRGPHWLVAGRVPQCKCAWQWMRSACFALPYVACPIIHSSPNQPTPAGQWEQLARVLRAVGAAGKNASALQGRECSREEYPGASAHGHRCAVLCFVWTLHGTSHHTCASPTPAGQHGNLPRCECAWRWMRCASLALHCMSHHPFTPSRAAAQSARVRVRMAMDALCFADERWLVCGSDTTGSAPSTIVLWDTSRPPSSSAAPSASPAATATPGASAPSAGPSVFHMPAFSSFVTCVAANPTDSRTVVAGGGDGGVALFDSRMHKAITRFSLGGSFEVTSAALSPSNPTCSRLCALVVWLEHAESGVRGGRGGGVSASCALWIVGTKGSMMPGGSLLRLASVAVWDLKRDLTLADPLTAFSFNWLNDQSCILLTLQPFPCSSAVPSIPPSPQQCGSACGLADKAVALASPSLHGRLRGHPVTPALPFEASQKPFLCSSSPSLHDQVAVAPDDACIATGGDDQKVVSAFSPLSSIPRSSISLL